MLVYFFAISPEDEKKMSIGVQCYLQVLLLTAGQIQIILSEGKQQKINHQELPKFHHLTYMYVQLT